MPAPPRARRRILRCPAGRRRGRGPGASSRARCRPTPAAPTPRLRQLRAWLNDRPFYDASVAAYRRAPPPDGPGADEGVRRAGAVGGALPSCLRARKALNGSGCHANRPGQRPGGGGVRPPAQPAGDDLGQRPADHPHVLARPRTAPRARHPRSSPERSWSPLSPLSAAALGMSTAAALGSPSAVTGQICGHPPHTSRPGQQVSLVPDDVVEKLCRCGRLGGRR